MTNPIDESEALPLEAVTLDNIPLQHQNKYLRKMDGTGFRRKYVDSSDARTIFADALAANAGKIQPGSITILEPGETPESVQRKVAADDAARTAFMDSVNAKWDAFNAER